jgi:hypothetical protein
LQVVGLFGWKAENVLGWLLSKPKRPDDPEAGDNLLGSLDNAQSPKEAAALVLNAIWSRQVP